MSDFEKEPARFHVDGLGITPDKAIVLGHVHDTEGMSDAEIQRAIANQTGVDIVDIAVGGAIEERPRNVGRRVFGFSNWNGSKWEPTGPKTNPNLN